MGQVSFIGKHGNSRRKEIDTWVYMNFKSSFDKIIHTVNRKIVDCHKIFDNLVIC